MCPRNFCKSEISGTWQSAPITHAATSLLPAQPFLPSTGTLLARGSIVSPSFSINPTLIHSFSLAVLPLATKGRPDKATVPRIDGHSSLVTDFAFSPHDDGLLATGSQDQTVKIWRIPRAGLSSNLTVPEVSLGEQARRVETVSWHPTAEALLASSSGQGIALWDLSVGRQAWTYNGHADQVYPFCPRSNLKQQQHFD